MIAIVDYEAGNLASVERALRRVRAECCVTQEPEALMKAERIVFPGVGAAGKAMAELRRLGLDQALAHTFRKGTPILGICIGAQIILERSAENQTPCLGLLPGEVAGFPDSLPDGEGRNLKVPHMGWNSVRVIRPHPLFEGLREADEFYFVHSYFPRPSAVEDVYGTTHYGITFPSVIGHRNLVACQFHLEKSGPPGLRMLENFCRWDGRHAE